MATREEWVRHFEDVNGRKPSPEEFMEAKKDGFVIASEEEASQVSEQVEAQQVDSSEATEEVAAESEADAQPDEAQVTLEEEAPKQLPELNMEKEQEKEVPKTSQIPLENPYYKPKEVKNNTFVNIVLPIIILVLGLLFAVLAWTIGFIFTFLAFFLIILAIVTMVLSLKSTRKALSIIALVMSIIFFMTSLAGTGYQVVKYVMNHAEEFQSDGNDKAYQYINENYKFDWTEDQFKELKVGTLTLDEVLDTHGKATDAEYSEAYEEDEPDLLDLTYRKEGTDGNNYVRLTFEKKDDVYVLKSASATFDYDKVKEVDDYRSNWTKDDYEKLALGTQADLLKGTRLSEVVEKHPEASFTYHEMTQTEQGDLTQSVSLSYRDYNPESGKLGTVRLTFDYDKRENEYFLTDKSDE